MIEELVDLEVESKLLLVEIVRKTSGDNGWVVGLPKCGSGE